MHRRSSLSAPASFKTDHYPMAKTPTPPRPPRVPKSAVAGFALMLGMWGAYGLTKGIAWLVQQPWAPRVGCVALLEACKEAGAASSPVSLPAPQGNQTLPDASGRCPQNSERVDGGCWVPLEKRPPCDVSADPTQHESGGKCWIRHATKPPPRPSSSGQRIKP